jgi:ADP-ribosylglycohydrolase
VLRQRFRGAVLGVAIGDAIGMPAEGMSASEIKQNFGRITDFLPSPLNNLKAGEWTDDTGQMIVLAESILETTYFNPENFAMRLESWAKGKRIGPTTRKALKNLAMGISWRKSGVYADTCGAVMRIAPIGLAYHFSIDLVERYAVVSSVVTHRGEGAVSGAVAVATAIACICSNFSFKELVREVISRSGEYDELMAKKIQHALKIANANLNFAAEKLGTSMYSWDAVPMAFYCLFSSHSYKECVLKAANAGGDTDSIAAMAGGMKGAEVGVDNIPSKWVKMVKDHEYLLELADGLYDLHAKISIKL